MRDLIRPTLFMIARLGLFLAVVAWIVGQWWSFSSAMAINTHSIAVGSHDGALIFSLYEIRIPERMMFKVMAPEMFNSPGVTFDTNKIVPGISTLSCPFVTAIAIRHWLVLTAIVTINIFLHWFYRKRSEVVPCEV